MSQTHKIHRNLERGKTHRKERLINKNNITKMLTSVN